MKSAAVRASWLSLPLLTALAACNAILGYGDFQKVDGTTTPTTGGNDDGGGGGTTPPATTTSPTSTVTPASTCAVAAPFTSVTPITAFNTSQIEQAPTLSPDELQIWFERSDTSDVSAIMTATRATLDAPWGAATPVSELGNVFSPNISKNLQMILFGNQIPGNSNFGIWVGTRGAATGAFGNVRQLTTLNGSAPTIDFPNFSSTTNELFVGISTDSGSTFQLARATFNGTDFSVVSPVTELAGTANSRMSALTADGLTIYFGAKPTGNLDVFMASRPNVTGSFGTVTTVDSVNSTNDDQPTWISADNCRLYLSSRRSGGGDLYVATRAR